jgi:uncharacterized protein (TIGR00730 family)
VSAVVAVVGSARVCEGDAEYEDAREVGRLLAEAGWTVATGGYLGVMEAACRGAADAGGHTIGVTVSGWPHRRPNPWVGEERPGEDLFERLRILVGGCDAMLAVAGGVGTLAEVAVAWNLMQHIARDGGSPRPIVLMGRRWAGMSQAFAEHLVDAREDQRLLETVVDPPTAVAALRRGAV